MRFGVGRGYHTREVEVFGSPIMDQNANRELFEEQVEVIWKAFNQRSFSHHGKHFDVPPQVPYRGYDLEEITLVPRPKNEVEWWQPVVSASDRAINFMAKWGINGIIGGGAATGGASDDVIQRWQAIHAEHGKDYKLGEGLIVGYSVQIADTEKEADGPGAAVDGRAGQDVWAAGLHRRVERRAAGCFERLRPSGSPGPEDANHRGIGGCRAVSGRPARALSPAVSS